MFMSLMILSASFLIKDFVNIKKSNVQLKEAPEYNLLKQIPHHTLKTVDINDKVERRKQQKRNYYNNHKEKFKQYNLKNKEKILVYQMEYRNKNKNLKI